MWIVAGVAGLCIFLNSLHGELIFDDVHAVQRNKDVLGGTTLSELFLNDFWGEPISSNSSHKSYRPFTVLTFRANHMIHGMHPTGYHFVNVAFHAIVSALSERVYTVLLKDSAVAETAALLFALHPVHCEAVASIVGRAEVFGALFALLAVLALPPLFEQGSTQIRKSKSEGVLGGANDVAAIRDRNVRMGRGEDAHENREAHALESKLDSASLASGDLLATKWGWILAAGACSIMATLSKETGATVLLFFIARDILDIYTAYVFRAAAFHHTHTHMPLPLSNTYSISADKWLHRHLWNAGGRIVAAAALFCSILGARKWLTGARFGPEFSRVDNPFYYMEGGVEWMLSISVLHGVYARQVKKKLLGKKNCYMCPHTCMCVLILLSVLPNTLLL
jgi:Na+-transporting NADH:ubiquinone oxidoreductase subunit NqrE